MDQAYNQMKFTDICEAFEVLDDCNLLTQPSSEPESDLR